MIAASAWAKANSPSARKNLNEGLGWCAPLSIPLDLPVVLQERLSEMLSVCLSVLQGRSELIG